jgi:hypothetical protein
MQSQTTPILQELLPLQPLRLALHRTMPQHRSVSLIGASIGLVVYFFVGLLPSMLLGGSAGAQLALGLLGEAPGYGVSAIMVLGVVSATTVGAAFFAVLGAVAAAAIHQLTGLHAARQVAP